MSINGPEYYNYNYTGNINVGTFIGRMYPEYSQPEKPSKGQSYRLRAQTYGESGRFYTYLQVRFFICLFL